MSKSDLLRVQDVREAYRVIGDCRDLGADPVLRQPRMAEGACRLIGAPVAVGGEGRWIRPHQPIQTISACPAGLDAHGIEGLRAYRRDLGPHKTGKRHRAGPDKLAPQLRQTLACLLEGDSEKETAVRLGLSRVTAHQYVTALYRHFRVRSRAQLLAHIIKRMGPAGAWGRWRGGVGP